MWNWFWKVPRRVSNYVQLQLQLQSPVSVAWNGQKYWRLPLDGMLVGDAAFNSPEPFICSWVCVLPRNRTQCPWPGLEPSPAPFPFPLPPFFSPPSSPRFLYPPRPPCNFPFHCLYVIPKINKVASKFLLSKSVFWIEIVETVTMWLVSSSFNFQSLV